MFSPGFRLFMGFAGFAVLAAFFYGVVSGDGGGADYLGFLDAESWVGAASLGWKGGVGDHVGYVILVMLGIVSGGLALMLVAFRDADPESVAELNGGELPPAQGPTATNYWPIVGAFGAGVTIIGLSTHVAIFFVGILVLAGVAFEWMMSAWADRATGDPAANRELRNRIMKPVEIPVLGVLGIAALVLSASRLFLAVPEAWAVWCAVGFAAIIFLGALLFAMADDINPNVVAAVLAVGAIAALTTGIVTASIGERDIEHHEPGAHHEGVEEGALAW
jgi:hypothetical protein